MDPEREDYADRDPAPRRLLTTLIIVGVLLVAMCGGWVALMVKATREFNIPD